MGRRMSLVLVMAILVGSLGILIRRFRRGRLVILEDLDELHEHFACAIADEIIQEFITYAELESDGATATHAAGAAASIIDLPGVIKQ